jgi:steroid delta-isomerase-like uncharacterized protein
MSGSSAIVRRFIDEFQNKHDFAVAEELLAPDFVDHSPFGTLPPDREGVLALFTAMFAGFPDLRAELHDQTEAGNRVWTRKTFHGTHTGDFMGIAATGRTVAFDVIDVVEIRDQQMVEHWNVVDAMGLMQQLGVAAG